MGGFWSDIGNILGGVGLGALSLIPGVGTVTGPAAAGMLAQGVSGMVTEDPSAPKQKPGLMLASKNETAPDTNYLDTNYVEAIRRLGGA